MNASESRRLVGTIALCLVVFAAGGCNRKPAANGSPFPASNDVAGWAKTDEVRTFEAADLWKYIDGGADLYLKAGAQRVSTADYRFQNKVDAVVDIYTMANSDGAAQIFDSEPAGDAKAVPLGDAARLYGQSLIFRKGTALVRIVAYQGSAETPPAMIELGRNIVGRLAK